MDRVVFVIVLGLLIFVILQLTKNVDDDVDEDDYVGHVEKPECEECALTSLEPKRVCPSGMCSQNGRLGCKV